jgi:quaternary ammonium compound-resistance protein SugE
VTWVLLLVAGVLETVFAIALKQSDGLSPIGWTALFVVAAAASFALLTIALRDLPVGTAYAVWTGIGAVGTALVGIVFLGDAASAARLASIALIVGGVVGLNIAGAGH